MSLIAPLFSAATRALNAARETSAPAASSHAALQGSVVKGFGAFRAAGVGLLDGSKLPAELTGPINALLFPGGAPGSPTATSTATVDSSGGTPATDGEAPPPCTLKDGTKQVGDTVVGDQNAGGQLVDCEIDDKKDSDEVKLQKLLFQSNKSAMSKIFDDAKKALDDTRE